jgi:hypothetical protein
MEYVHDMVEKTNVETIIHRAKLIWILRASTIRKKKCMLISENAIPDIRE